jgi:hypothetical protein
VHPHIPIEKNKQFHFVESRLFSVDGMCVSQILKSCMKEKTNLFYIQNNYILSVLRIRIVFNTDPDTDPGPGFLMTKNWETLRGGKNFSQILQSTYP